MSAAPTPASIDEVESLRAQGDEVARERLRRIVAHDPVGRVRRVACHALRACRAPQTRDVLAEALRRDPAPFVRRGLVEVLGERGAASALVVALTDPVYRVRRQASDALARALHRGQWSGDALVDALVGCLAQQPAWLRGAAWHRASGAVQWMARTVADGEGLVAALEARVPTRWRVPRSAADEVLRAAPWFDEDPAMLRERLVHTPDAELAAWPEALGALLVHQDGYPVGDVLDEAAWHAVRVLCAHGEVEQLASVLCWLEEPRLPDVAWWCWHLVAGLSPVRRDALRDAVDAEAHPVVGRFLASWRAEHIPERSYWVRWRASVLERPRELTVATSPGAGPGLDGARSPIAVSGRFGLPVEGFARALERGVDLFFWEPEYTHLTSTVRALSAPERAGLHLIAGTFKVDADDVRRDLEATLSTLGVDRVAVFLLFWVRSRARLSEAVFERLAQAHAEGLVGSVGISTHDRELAWQALEVGAQTLMLRHNAAHRGAEHEGLLEHCEAQGAPVIAFNCSSYGQLIELGQVAGWQPADVYRYALSQPGVRACLSAPRTVAELEANLGVLERPTLPRETLETMREAATTLAVRNREFARLVRWR